MLPRSRSVMAATRGELFAGVTVAIVTPFKNGEIDWDDLGKLVDWHVEQGTDAPRARRHHRRIADARPRGDTSGSSPSSCEQARGRIKVMAGTGSNSTARSDPPDEGREEGRGRTARCRSGRTTTSRRRRATTATSRPSPRPCDLPHRPLQHPRPHRVEHRCPRRSPAWPRSARRSSRSRRRPARSTRRRRSRRCRDLTILSGDDSLTLPLMSIGGQGVVSVVGNIVPRDMMALVKAFAAGKIDGGASSGTASCSRSAATCSAWRPTRSRSRRR